MKARLRVHLWTVKLQLPHRFLGVEPRNANNVTRVTSALKQSRKCQRRLRKHVDCQPARMKMDEPAGPELDEGSRS